MKTLKRSYILNKIDIYNCWEDFSLIQRALKINGNDIVFSITSGGCNILNFLLYNPKKIITVDYNPYQNYLLELKIAAIKNLCYSDFLKVMGIIPSNENEELYKIIKNNLSKNARLYWDSNTYVINRGITCVGEGNIKKFGNFLRFLKGTKTIENYFYCKTIDEQADYFYKHIYGFPWKLSLIYAYNNYTMKSTLFFNMLREIIYKRERLSEKEYFRYIRKIKYPKNHLKRIEDIFTKITIRTNYFLSQILLGYYINEDCFPPYLKKENYNLLKQNLDRIEIKTSSVYESLKNFPEDYISKFNLSNILDWNDDDIFVKSLDQITRVGKNNGRFFYSTARNDRNIPKDYKSLTSDKQFANELIKEDRTTMYSRFELGTITK